MTVDPGRLMSAGINNKYKKVILPKEAVLMLAFLFNSFFIRINISAISIMVV
ncbi:hypothetical protein [Butyrivibrio sp. INlla14]|uniref:hypothetical protein n=1 Tax=Butyrivibrio sp. INlla14 TaxID=1520808 RepID=UPI0008769119|nr:hypothetical protein [Butyrivibrio sp. INlla14]SCY17212.1 hypothetical protein SAMN02910371_01335 [Butyrivibrio sp. INlla14]SCY22359.1 hypothetical protein SAMN02910371_01464 [Butyrivibrio sp. INlla14]